VDSALAGVDPHENYKIGNGFDTKYERSHKKREVQTKLTSQTKRRPPLHYDNGEK
jgi:hypothetical protein